MTLLSFPDVNVRLAVILEHHEHHAQALAWWGQTNSIAAFTRLTQMSVLRLLTTAAVMDGQPLSLAEAWQAAYLIAFASGHEGQLVTFDRALKNRGADCLVLR